MLVILERQQESARGEILNRCRRNPKSPRIREVDSQMGIKHLDIPVATVTLPYVRHSCSASSKAARETGQPYREGDSSAIADIRPLSKTTKGTMSSRRAAGFTFGKYIKIGPASAKKQNQKTGIEASFALAAAGCCQHCRHVRSANRL